MKNIKLYGSGYGDIYEVNDWGDIITSGGMRTGYSLRGSDLVDESGRTIGFLHFGNVDYANDYSGSQPFRRYQEL